MQFGWIAKMLNFGTRRSPILTETAPPELKLYRSIHNLPMPVFIECLISGNPSGITLSGTPTNEQLSEAWEGIMSQYSEAIAQTEVKSAISEMKSLALKEDKIVRIEYTLDLLKTLCDTKSPLLPALFESLYKFGYTLPRKEYSPENLSAVLKIFMGHFRFDRTQYRLMEERMRHKGPKEQGNRYDWAYFEDMLCTICITLKLPIINLRDITVGQYCSYTNQFNTYVKTMQKQNQ